MNRFDILSYEELTKDQLYCILRLRTEVFVVEQRICYQDMDNLDQQALHVLLQHQNTILAYARVLTTDKGQIRFGRVLTAPDFRGQGHGKELMQRLMNWLHQQYKGKMLHIHAQAYLQTFYQNFGLETQGEPYILEDIAHLSMTKQL